MVNVKRLVPVLLSGCATLMGKPDRPVGPLREPSWEDTGPVRAAVCCAAHRIFTARAAVQVCLARVRVRDGLGVRGFSDPESNEIVLNAGAESAQHSAWRHEAVHVGLWVDDGGNGHANHDQQFLDIEGLFNLAYGPCRIPPKRQVEPEPEQMRGFPLPPVTYTSVTARPAGP